MSAATVKVTYVRRARQTRQHTCHWPGCDKQVPPAMWGCREHWYKLPRHLRMAVWAAYRVGQEEDLQVSAEYMKAARDVQDWIATQHLLKMIK